MDQKNKALFVYMAPADTAYQVEKASEYGMQVRPKLGFLYLSSVLKRRKGITCEIWDQTVSYFDVRDLAGKIGSGDYLFVGFYSAISMDGRVTDCIRRLRGDHGIAAPILVGGPSFVKAEEFLRAGCDIVCNGEAEEIICDICDHLAGGKPLAEIMGISYLAGGKTVTNERRPLITAIDDIPFPDYGAIDINRFHDFYIFTMRKPYTTMMASRGCPYNCSFCESPGIWGRRYRLRSADNVLAEVDELVKKYGVRYIAFQDDVFGMDYGWTEEFCGKLKSRDYDLRWMCILHPFSFRKDRLKMLRMLRLSGCDTVSTGLQSAHPEILRRLNRSPEEPDGIKEIVRSARRAGLLSLVSFIFGSPGETSQTILTSIEYASRVKPNYARFYSMVILPGSEIARSFGTDGRLCELSDAEIERWCRLANRKFFLMPDVFARNILFILRRNPTWFLTAGKHLFHILDTIGLGAAMGGNDCRLAAPKPGA